MWILGRQNWLYTKNTRAPKATCYGQRRRSEITGILFGDQSGMAFKMSHGIFLLVIDMKVEKILLGLSVLAFRSCQTEISMSYFIESCLLFV